MKSSAIKRIGILRGGVGENYVSSLRAGGDLIVHLAEHLADKYKISDILVDKDHIWHLNGLPVSPSDLMNKFDLVWNTSHPSFSNILESLFMPSIKVPAFCRALETSREILREHINHAKYLGVSLPRSLVIPLYQPDIDGPRERYAIKKAKEVHEKFPAPWVVRSFTPDANMGVHIVKTFPELVESIEDGVKHKKSILVEEFISGKATSLHSVRGFRGKDVYVFPLTNILDHPNGNFSSTEKENLENLAQDLHEHTGAEHYLKSDFVVTLRGKIYLTNIESTPNLKPGSHFHHTCDSVGAKVHHIVDHILESV